MKNNQWWFIVWMVVVISLAVAGCGNPLQSDHQKISAAFKEIDLSGILDGTGVHDSNASSKTTTSGIAWTGTIYTDLNFNSKVTNITINGNTATATGNFTFSGKYISSGTFMDLPWSYSKSFSASGEGTVHFVKVNDKWRVNAIEEMLLKGDNSGGEAPYITPIELDPGYDIAAGADVTLSTSVINNLQTPGAKHIGFFVVTRGFIRGVNNNPQWGTDVTYPYSAAINTNLLNYKGNHYGAIVAYQLVGNPDPKHPEQLYGVYFSIRISMFTIH